VPSQLTSESAFVCKPCKTFCGIRHRSAGQPDYLRLHKQDRAFYKDYRKKLQSKLGMEDSFSSESSDKSPKKIHQVSRTGDNPTKITIKTTTVDSGTSSSAASGGTSSLNQTEIVEK
jgi:hypothetical protein